MKLQNTILNYQKWRLVMLCMIMLGSYNVIYAQSLITLNYSTTISCNDDGTISFSISGGTSPYRVSVINKIKEVFYSANSTSVTSHTVSNLANGYYHISIEGSGPNEYKYASVYIAPSFSVTVNTTPENCSADGSLNANVSGGSGPYTYLWSNGATTQTVTDVSSGSYGVVVTDANGCKNHDSDSIFVQDVSTLKLSTSSTPKSCNIFGTASVSASGGTGPYTYYWNTTPVQTTATAINLTPDSYMVTVTDANGCVDKGWVYVTIDNDVLKLSTSYMEENCSSQNGSATVNVGNGTSPFQYQWSNGQTTPTASNLARGWYSVTVKDANACESIASVFVTDVTPFDVKFTSVTPTCGANDGSITVNVTGGTGPYTYEWASGATSQSISGVPSGGYSVTITDATGCSKTAWGYLGEAANCFVIISGKVYNDINGNCVQDAGENGIAGAVVRASNSWLITTGYDGVYSFWASPGVYTISQTVPLYYGQTCPVTPGVITVNATTPGIYAENNFANQVTTQASDLEVDVYCGAPRPGFTRANTLAYINKGTVPTTATIEYTFSGPWEYSSSFPSADNYNPVTKKAVWNMPTIQSGEQGYITIYMSVAPTVQLGVDVSCKADISTPAMDITPANNHSECATKTVGSFDPNDIQVFPKGDGTEGYISEEDSLLTYLIRFQNTGSDTAYTVVVKDTLDANLTKESIQSVMASHPCEVNVKGNILEFTFNDIDLLDSTFNEKASHGFVSYKIKRKKSLLPGEKIKNKSDIYFDYNAPVATNRVHSTIALETSLSVESNNDNVVNAFPVPFNEQINLTFNKEMNSHVTIKLVGMNGEDLGIVNDSYVTSGQNDLELNLSQYNLKPGIYILKVIENEKVYHKENSEGE